MDQVMEQFDLLFSQMNSIGVIQQETKKELTATKEDQKLIAKQVQANGQAVATLTLLRQMEKDAMSDHSDGVSVVFDEANPDFQDVFATKKTDFRPGTSKQHRHYRDCKGP